MHSLRYNLLDATAKQQLQDAAEGKGVQLLL